MIKLEIDCWKLKEIAKQDPAQYEMLRAAQGTLPTIEDVLADKGYMAFQAYINDVSELPDWVFEKASFKPIRTLKLMVDGRVDMTAVKEALSVAQVHLPGNELLRIHEVQVREDCCTDLLQEQLKAGWRIIAVCPQPSRRPDYVLGRL